MRSLPELSAVHNSILAYDNHPHGSSRELLSFAVSSQKMEADGSAGNSRARLALLRLDSPLERLRSVL